MRYNNGEFMIFIAGLLSRLIQPKVGVFRSQDLLVCSLFKYPKVTFILLLSNLHEKNTIRVCGIAEGPPTVLFSIRLEDCEGKQTKIFY